MKQAEAERDALRDQVDALQAERDRFQAKAASWRRVAEGLQAQMDALKEALLSSRCYVETACGSQGLTAGMAEQELQRIDAAIHGPKGLTRALPPAPGKDQ